MKIVIKEGDTYPPVKAKLLEGDNEPLPLDSATVKLNILDRQGNLLSSNTAQITDATDGRVKYEWDSTDTDTAGKFKFEFEVDYGNGRVVSVPNNDYIDLVVIE